MARWSDAMIKRNARIGLAIIIIQLNNHQVVLPFPPRMGKEEQLTKRVKETHATRRRGRGRSGKKWMGIFAPWPPIQERGDALYIRAHRRDLGPEPSFFVFVAMQQPVPVSGAESFGSGVPGAGKGWRRVWGGGSWQVNATPHEPGDARHWDRCTDSPYCLQRSFPPLLSPHVSIDQQGDTLSAS